MEQYEKSMNKVTFMILNMSGFAWIYFFHKPEYGIGLLIVNGFAYVGFFLENRN